MKYYILLIIQSPLCLPVYSQHNNRTDLQIGLTANFLHKVGQIYSGPKGATDTYEYSDLIPLPGIIFGFDRSMRLTNTLFLRPGATLGYHVTSAKINYASYLISGNTLISDKQNEKTRFRNLYVQLPLNIGILLGEKKVWGICGGVRASYLLINGSIWHNVTVDYNYDFSQQPPVYESKSHPDPEKVKLDIHKVDFAAEVGFLQKLSQHLALEESISKGFIPIADFSEGSDSDNLKQITVRVALRVDLSKR